MPLSSNGSVHVDTFVCHRRTRARRAPVGCPDRIGHRSRPSSDARVAANEGVGWGSRPPSVPVHEEFLVEVVRGELLQLGVAQMGLRPCPTIVAGLED